jgi:hypothetical protein
MDKIIKSDIKAMKGRQRIMASKSEKNDIDRSGTTKNNTQISNTQINPDIGDCRIKLNFNPTPGSGVLNDVKKMILSGLSKV